MFPAARIGDPVTHDSTTPSGTIGPPLQPPAKAPVLVEGLPAAYVTCTVACSGATSGGPAHPPPGAGTPPAPILLGSTSVFINGLPAARWMPSGDFAGCTVQLGSPALAAERTVLVGGLAAPTDFPFLLGQDGQLLFGAALAIDGDDLFKSRVANRLLKIASVPSGTSVLKSLEGSGKQVEIRQATGDEGSSQASVDDAAASKAGQQVYDGEGKPRFDADGTPMLGTGTGSSSVVLLDPSDSVPNPHDPSQPITNDAVLLHELVHADHAAHGTQDCASDKVYDTKEEKETINGGPPSETSYLRERGHKWHRVDHGDTLRPMPKD